VTDSETGEVTEQELFTYSQQEGGSAYVDIGAPPANAVAAWHSHPANSSDYFSASLTVTPDGPGSYYSSSEGDIAYAYRYKTPLYLITPGGYIKRADPSNISRVYKPNLVPPGAPITEHFVLYYTGEK